MNPSLWQEVDAYVEATVVGADDALGQALEHQQQSGLPSIAVSAAQGKLLQLLARSVGARRILEVGTLGGYSTIWLARALPAGGRLVTLELDPKHARVARENFTNAGVGDRIELREGPASRSLVQMRTEMMASFDFTFIDADKASIPEYFEHAIALSRPGALIVVDNVVRRGALNDPTSTDPSVVGVRRLHEQIAAGSRVDATTIQTVGAKGYDGFLLAIVRGIP
jgi:predicted O-methyltransferase YrrM